MHQTRKRWMINYFLRPWLRVCCLDWLLMGNGASVRERTGAVGGFANVARGDIQRETLASVAVLTGARSDYSVWIELRIACRDLLNKDVGSVSDPMAVLLRETSPGQWSEIGRTEIIVNNLNPSFLEAFQLLYHFERKQKFKIAVYDVDEMGDSSEMDLEHQDFLGEASFLLSELVSSTTGKRELTLWDPEMNESAGDGVLIVRYEELTNQSEIARIEFSACDFSGGSRRVQAVIRISKSQEDSSWTPVYRTEPLRVEQPKWKPVEMSLLQLCNGDMARALKIEILDYKASGKHKVLAETTTTTSQLQNSLDAPFALSVPGTSKPAGCLVVHSFSIRNEPTFLEYISAGFEICFLLAVDFTASNGMPGFPTSLHHLDKEGKKKNQYEEAIEGVGRVLEFYDYDKLFPTWGFGGRLPMGVSHCFALNRVDARPECEGVSGILETYRKALKEVKLAGPTLFAPVISAATHIASRPAQPPKYYCLMILTDGCIMDMKNTMRAVVEASRMPLSILIVGVGDEDFSKMDILDSDTTILEVEGMKAERDIVQFVEFNKFKKNGEALAEQLLAELPGQFLGYMKKQKILPSAKKQENQPGPDPNPNPNPET